MLTPDIAPALPAALDLGGAALAAAMVGGLGALIARLLGWLRPQPVPVPIPVRAPRAPQRRRR
jgi:hypothetical protein